MEYKYPNYNDCITNLSCSILKHFNCKYFHNTISDVDKLLEESNPKNVIVILYDGMGYNLVNRILDKNSFMVENMVRSFSSVCPATTTASTTAILSGKNPCEHGWLAWDLYIPPINKIVTMFLNTLKDSEEPAADYHVAYKFFPYKNIIDTIKEESNNDAYYVSPYGDIKYETLDEMINIISDLTKKPNKKYIYAYFENPDSLMHEFGTNSQEAINSFKEIDDATKRLSNEIEDSVIIVVADHGHINSEAILISNYPDFKETLDGDVWFEGRFCSFKVKNKDKFLELFNKYFKDYFILKTKEEIINEKILGTGEENKYFRDCLGDYFALAISNKIFKYDEKSHIHMSSHAGITTDEMDIPLIMKRVK